MTVLSSISSSPAQVREELDRIATRIAVDAKRAIESFEMLEAGNKPVFDALRDVETKTAFGHRYIQNATGVMLATEISRLFDEGGKPKGRQTKASFPILSHRLEDAAVRALIVNEARAASPERHAECLTALKAFDDLWNGMQSNPQQLDAVRKLRTLRDYEIAHSIYDRKVEPPTYQELFDLMETAIKLADAATKAVGSGKSYLADFQLDRRDLAREFWDIYIRAVKEWGAD